MRRVMFVLLGIGLCVVSGCGDLHQKEKSEAPVILKGKVSLVEGDFKEGFIKVRQSWKIKGFEREVAMGKDGRFEIGLPGPDQYLLLFAHAGYEPISGIFNIHKDGEYRLDVTMDRYRKSADGRYQVITELNRFSLSSGLVPMRKVTGGYRAEITGLPPDKISLDYQVYHDQYRSFNGNDPLAGHDRSGDYKSRVPVRDGRAVILFDDSGLRQGPSRAALKGSAGLRVDAAIADYRNRQQPYTMMVMKKSREMMKKKLSRNTPKDPSGLEPLIQWGIDTIRSQADEEMKALYGILLGGGMLRQFTDQLEPFYTRGKAYLKQHPGFAEKNYLLLTHFAREMIPPLTRKSGMSREEGFRTRQEKREAFFSSYLERDILPAIKLEILSGLVNTYRYNISDQKKLRLWVDRIERDFPGAMLLPMYKRDLARREMIGAPAPAFEYASMTGDRVKLADFLGKYVLLDIWATWCGPCVAEIPHMVKSFSRVDKSRVAFVSVCIDAQGDRLQKFVEQRGVKWTQLQAPGNWKADIIAKYKVSGIPCIFLIDPKGKIRVVNEGLRGERLIPTLNRFLNQPEGGRKVDAIASPASAQVD